MPELVDHKGDKFRFKETESVHSQFRGDYWVVRSDHLGITVYGPTWVETRARLGNAINLLAYFLVKDAGSDVLRKCFTERGALYTLEPLDI